MLKIAKLYRYALPIQSQLILRGHKLYQREGLIVHLQQGDLQGFGEIAPLVGFSTENLPQAEQQAKEWLSLWQKHSTQINFNTLYPSVAFGISCAIAELQQKFTITANFYTVPLCLSETDFTKLENTTLAKIKVGIQAAKQEGQFANRLLQQLPQLRLRLDANRKWSLDEAMTFTEQVNPKYRSRFDFIEEPCQTPELSREFAVQSTIPIAWDETTREADFTLQAEPYLAAIILKPSLVGSLEKNIEFIYKAHQLGLQAVISSSLESSLGLSQLAQIATQYTPKTAAGLDTLNLMQHQLLRRWGDSQLPIIGLNSAFIQEVK